MRNLKIARIKEAKEKILKPIHIQEEFKLRPNELMQRSDATNLQALKDILAITILATGAGAGYKALGGFSDYLINKANAKKKIITPGVVEIGVPRFLPPKEARDTSDSLPLDFRISTEPKPSTLDWILGRTHEDKTYKPWFWTAAIGGPMLGFYGGYKLVDNIIEKLHKYHKERELARAKDEYRKALVSQYSPAQLEKNSAFNSLDKNLRILFNMSKEAREDLTNNALSAANNAGGLITSMYLPLALLLYGGTALATYNLAKSKSPEERLAKAIKQREYLRWATRPPEVFAMTKAIPVERKSKKDSTEEEHNLPIGDKLAECRKIASFYKI